MPNLRADMRDTRRRLRAFTLTELLAVIVIIVLLISIAVPAFASMVRSTNAALASSNFRLGLAAARNAAVRSAGVNDAAAVFFYEPDRGTSIVTCIAVGELDGRTVFARDPLTEPLYLPEGWMVSGYAPQGLVDAPNAASEVGEPYLWYESDDDRYDPDEPNWVFPETDFFRGTNQAGRDVTPGAGDEGRFRQTFMVRFDGKTGGVAVDDRGDAIVFSPDLRVGRGVNPWRQREDPWRRTEFRLDGQTDQPTYVRRVLNAPWGASQYPLVDREQLIGDDSVDTVLARPVDILSLYNVRDVARQIANPPQGSPPQGFRGVDRTTRSLYEPSPTGPAQGPIFRFSEAANTAIPAAGSVFTVDRYTGQLVEVRQ